MTDTATVETLTAEVRTLVVGSRQVTLSVAKQLDVIELADLEVFGRVKLSDDHQRVIGADRDGVLSLAFVPGEFYPPIVDLDDLTEGYEVHCCRHRLYGGEATFTWPTQIDWRFRFAAESVSPCCDMHEFNRLRQDQEKFEAHLSDCALRMPEPLWASVSDGLADAINQGYDHWLKAVEAPLIVLAGLK